MIAEKLPDLTAHLNECGVDSGMITFNWFVTLFVDPLPMEVGMACDTCIMLLVKLNEMEICVSVHSQC